MFRKISNEVLEITKNLEFIQGKVNEELDIVNNGFSKNKCYASTRG